MPRNRSVMLGLNFESAKEIRISRISLGILLIILILLLILVLILGWYIFDVGKNESQDYTETIENLENNETFLDLSNNDPEVGGVVEKVSRHILLPSKEFTVATINDAEKLKQQADPVLFQYVEDGQKALIYETGVIVYDPSLDKIVDVIQYYPVRLEQLRAAEAGVMQPNK